MTTHRLLFAAACLVAGSGAAAQRVDPPPERINGPEVGEQVRRDLGGLFQPGGVASAGPGDGAAAEGRIRTRPYATRIANLCRRDEVTLSYAGRGTYGGGAAANMVQPFGVTASAWFRVLGDLDPSAPGYGGRPFEGACAALSDAETRGWFAAPDASVARDGYRIFLTASRQVNAPAHGITGCRETLHSQQDCRNALSAPERITGISQCAALGRRACYAISFANDDYHEIESVTLRLHYNGRWEPIIDAVEIEWPTISI